MRQFKPKLTESQRRATYAARKVMGVAIGLLVVLAIVVGDRLGVFGAHGTRAATGPDYERYHGRTFRVAHVVDGDTIDVDAPDGSRDRTRIRLWGVDTPETRHPDKPVQHFGPEAAAFTRQACEGKAIRLELLRNDTRDHYGRLLAYVILPDARVLNRELVRLGYGYADPRYPHPCQKEFLRLEDEAAAARVGLWQAVRNDDLPYYHRRRRQDSR